MQKFLYLIIFLGVNFNYSHAQTVEIGEMDLKKNNSSSYLTINNAETDLDESYQLQTVFFKYDEIDTDAYHNIYFTLYIDNGSTKFLLNQITYAYAEAGKGIIINDMTNIDGTSYSFPVGNFSITIEVTGLDSDNILQTIVESDPWTVSYSFNHILGNQICCSQNTFVFPFDPTPINQDVNTTISTQDGANITSIQWQKFANNAWSNISGATQMSYDPPSTSINIKYRRVLTSSSGATSNSNEISITKIAETISGNSICCSQTTAVMPFDPSLLNQATNRTLTSNIPGTTFTYQWQQTNSAGNFVNVQGATNSSYDPSFVKNPTLFRRIVFSSNGTTSTSVPIGVLLQSCSRPQDQQNIICGNQTFYKLKDGDTINPGMILGAYDTPDIIRREFGYDYMISYDGINWGTAQSKQLLSVNDNSPYTLCGRHQNPNPIINPKLTPLVNPAWWLITTLLQPDYAEPITDPVIQIVNALLPQDATNPSRACAINNGLLDYQPQSIIFNSNRGAVQKIYIRRDYYQWYDEFNCGPFHAPGPCGSSWSLMNTSNVVVITLTSGDFPKPVPPITSSRNDVTCNWSDQTINFSVPLLNNAEFYRWTIPAGWDSYSLLASSYANQISVTTNSGDGNYAKGGQVCLEVTQGSQVDRQCITFAGSSPTNIVLPATIQGCEGQTVVINPILTQGNAIANPANYNFSWQAYQSQNVNCGNLNDCKQLSLIVSNVRQYPTQAISVTVKDNLGCKTTANTTLVTAPGLQMGILNSYSDPTAISNSGLTINTVNNFLYFTGQNRNIYRSYYDNTPGQLIWKYVPLKDKNTNQAILSDGPVAYYKGATDKLFYVIGSSLYYAESTDNGLTWVDKFPYGSIAQNIDPRIKIYANNIYYIDISSRKVFSQNIINIPSSSVLVGVDQVNYSQRMFTVEDGILSYADVNSNIVAFDANTGTRFTLNVPAQFKQVNYNSSISTYNNNIYYTSSSGNLRILKKNTSTGIYDNYEEVSNPPSNNLQLAGPFAINKQTGTVYAKAYDVLGKQIYYLNSKWNFVPINNPLSYSTIQSDMTYTNEHAYYIGDGGYLSNTYYIAPCIPAVLRTANAFASSGDIMNDPLSNDVIDNHSVLFYPNPTTGIVKATFIIPEESKVRINIIPITGGASDVLSNKTMESGTQELLLDLSNYSSGVYLIQLYVNESLYTTSKVVKF